MMCLSHFQSLFRLVRSSLCNNFALCVFRQPLAGSWHLYHYSVYFYMEKYHEPKVTQTFKFMVKSCCAWTNMLQIIKISRRFIKILFTYARHPTFSLLHTLRATFHKFFQEFYLRIFKHIFLLYLWMKIYLKMHK